MDKQENHKLRHGIYSSLENQENIWDFRLKHQIHVNLEKLHKLDVTYFPSS